MTGPIVRDRSDNRWSNLRDVSKSRNGSNTSRKPGASGLRGAHRVELANGRVRYDSRINRNGERHNLGRFDTAAEAHAAYIAAGGIDR